MIEVRLITDLKEAERFWRALSPNQVIFDDWDFRACFYKYKPYPLRFYVAFEDGSEISEAANEPAKAIGLLPLQFNEEWGCLEFFAEDPCEENRVFIKPGREEVIPQLYGALKETAKFYDISGEDGFTRALAIEDNKYILPLDGLKSFTDYLATRLSPKKQRNFRSDFRKIEELDFKVLSGRNQDLETLFDLNNKNFPDSYLETASDRQSWQALLDLPFHWEIISLEIEGKIQAVSLAVLYNNIYFYLINGANFRDYPNLGKYLNRLNIEKAIELKAKHLDAGLGDCNWKMAWHFDSKPQYEFIK
jgi:CelD/BcsL family acetyltransferase involved in cellulose biosynthesis